MIGSVSALEPRLVEVQLSSFRKPTEDAEGHVTLAPARPVVQAEVVLELSTEALRLLARENAHR